MKMTEDFVGFLKAIFSAVPEAIAQAFQTYRVSLWLRRTLLTVPKSLKICFHPAVLKMYWVSLLVVFTVIL